MLAKINSKNQLTLPEEVAHAIGDAAYFEVEVRDGCIILTPVRSQCADAVRAKSAEFNLDVRDAADAVEWARTPVRKGGSAGAALYEAFVQDAQAADAEMRCSGLHYPAEDVFRYITDRAHGKPARRPKPKPWRR